MTAAASAAPMRRTGAPRPVKAPLTFWMERAFRSRLPWPQVVRWTAKGLEHKVAGSLPETWRPALANLSRRAAGQDALSHDLARVDALQAFAEEHHDVLRWNVCDGTVRERAKRTAEQVEELCSAWPGGLSEPERWAVVKSVCASVGVDVPEGLTTDGAIRRACDQYWWRRALRRKVSREVEHAAIKLGVVHRRTGGYASDEACARRRQQEERNAKLLGRMLMRNEAGQVYTLGELAALSVSNRDIRRGELMVRIRGCEEFADEAGHYGMFLTLTTPSRFHAVLSGGRGPHAKPRSNPRYRGASPREAQAWLCGMWAKARAKLGRKGIKFYGFRVAEPHHDATPHWHALIWCENAQDAAVVRQVITDYWLSDDGDERGALLNRCDFKRMKAGGAAGYVAKYVAKNIGAQDGGTVGIDQHTDTLDGFELVMDTREYKGFERVGAWAAHWGIRQFQPIGQPPVSVWREMRRVSKDQIDKAQLRLDFGDDHAVKAWHACRKEGLLHADWHGYVRAQGGMCRARSKWRLRAAVRITPDVENQYGEVIERRNVIGVETLAGHWLISRRQAWGRVVDEDAGASEQQADQRAALGRPWTCFNNCTARINHETRRQLFNGGKPWPAVHDTDWIEPAAPAPRPSPAPAPQIDTDERAASTWLAQPRALAQMPTANNPAGMAAVAARITPDLRAAFRAGFAAMAAA